MAVDRRILKFHNPLEEADKTDKFVGRSVALVEPRIHHEQIRNTGTVVNHPVLRLLQSGFLLPWYEKYHW
jgi:hypothetical protein